jgi:hypothetical protein
MEELDEILSVDKLSKIDAKRAVKIVKELFGVELELGCLCTSSERAILKTKLKRILDEYRGSE